MQSGLCFELVYIILITITEHTVGYSKQQWYKYQSYDFTNEHPFTMDYIIVKNPKAFEEKPTPTPALFEDETSEGG
jgi:hypothetical protein